ncbi:MAG: TcpD family membrane protein [Solirubrobacteraceae bacterium]|nr:TcpD family membrane protein [Patulibacter sp.]
MTNSTTVSRRPDLVTIAAGIVGLAIIATLAIPHEVWAAAGSSGSGGTLTAAKNFNKNGLSSLQAAGAVVFGVAAVWGLARAAFGGKVGQGLMQAAVAAVGFAVAAGPDTVLQTVGSWGTDLFS